MPIKFRCDKCRQFLGISRDLAGQIVDCPTCGRSTRVPKLDGTREPIPKQAEPLKPDSSLLSALDQLADLGKPDLTKVGDQTAVSSDAPPSAIAIEPVGVEKPIDPPPQAPQKKGSATSEKPAINSRVLSELAETMPLESATEPRPRFSSAWIAAACLGGVLLFAAGWIGRGIGGANLEQTKPAEPLADRPPVVVGPAVSSVNGIVGRISYRKPESDCLPDRGSRVIVWPVGFEPKDRWTPAGFRAGDSGPLTETARKSLQDAGGDLAVADEDGNFEVNLSTAGDFEILILSRFSGQGIDGQAMTAAQIARLKPCFAEPRRLTGKTQFRLIRMKYRGRGRHQLDQVFEVID
jgi:hypothetical protein